MLARSGASNLGITQVGITKGQQTMVVSRSVRLQGAVHFLPYREFETSVQTSVSAMAGIILVDLMATTPIGERIPTARRRSSSA